MKKSISTWQMVGFVFTGVLGTLLHFVFDWTDGSMIAAVFSAVNESIWEHIKLLIYPMLLFALVEYKVWGREVTCFWQVKLFGLLAGIVLIPGLYYTYTGILGKSADWFNITIFLLWQRQCIIWKQNYFKRKVIAIFPTGWSVCW